MKIFKAFANYTHGQVLDLPRIKFHQEKFNDFLKEKYGIIKPIKVIFGSSPFRWVVGSFHLRASKIILFWPGVINQAEQKNKPLSNCFTNVLAHETKHFLQSRSIAGSIWQMFQYFFWYFLIIITGFYCISANFLFFPLNLIFWSFSSLIYFILPCEISARQFVKKEITENQDKWLEFFDIF